MESVNDTAEDASADGPVRGMLGCASPLPFCCAALQRRQTKLLML